MNLPFFSVIIPTYNRAHVLARAIDSVLNQEFKDFELIVVDDGSTDNTKEIINKYTQRFKFVEQSNCGVSNARNNGVKLSSGNYIAFLDSDDYWHANKLKIQHEYIQNNPHTKLLHCDEIWIRNSKRVNPKNIHKKAGGDQFIRSMELCCISPSSVVVKREVFDEFSGFDENYTVCEDYDLWLKITYKYNIDFIEEKLITKTGGHDDQLSSKYKAMDLWRLKSLITFLNKSMSEVKKKALMYNIQTRIEILRKGYEKHAKFRELQELDALIKKHELE